MRTLTEIRAAKRAIIQSLPVGRATRTNTTVDGNVVFTLSRKLTTREATALMKLNTEEKAFWAEDSRAHARETLAQAEATVARLKAELGI